MNNPYLSPESSLSPSLASGGASQAILDALRRTRPWVRFFGVLGFISSGLMIVGGIIMVASGMGGPTGEGNAGIAFLYIVLTLIHLVPSVKLNHYASSINRLLASGSEPSLVEALEAQRSFWKTVGVFALVIICLYGVGGLILAIYYLINR